MSVVAFLVVGRDGSTTVSGTSAGISTYVDRQTFLNARRTFDCILIGGETARHEPYSKTPVPLIVLSRSRPPVLDSNPHSVWWNLPPAVAIQQAISTFGENVCVEGGGNFLRDLCEKKVIDELRLSITSIVGGENQIDLAQFLAYFSDISKAEVGDTTFITASNPS